jgi:hypothetical protein
LPNLILRAPPTSLVVNFAANRIGGERIFEHGRQFRGRRQRLIDCTGPRHTERLGETLQPTDESFHPLTIRVRIEVGSFEDVGPRNNDGGKRGSKALVESRSTIEIDTAHREFLLPPAAKGPNFCQQLRRRRYRLVG